MMVAAARRQTIAALAPYVGALQAWPFNGDALTAKHLSR